MMAVDPGVSLWTLAVRLIQSAPRIVLGALLLAAATVAAVMIPARLYTSHASFKPYGSGATASQLSAVASQFGVRIPAGSEDDSPDFYVALLTSYEVMQRLAQRSYAGATDRGDRLDQILQLEHADSAVRREAVMEWLQEEALSIRVDPVASLVQVSARTAWPELSRQLAAACLDEVNAFNAARRKTRAVEERAFVESRVRESEKELRAAERRLQEFLTGNRSFESYPALRFEYDRLARTVSLRQQLYSTLSGALEEARITEVRSTPVISVVQEAYAPARPNPRRLVLKLTLALMLGLAMGAGWVVLSCFLEPRSAEDRHGMDAIRHALPRALARRLGSDGQLA